MPFRFPARSSVYLEDVGQMRKNRILGSVLGVAMMLTLIRPDIWQTNLAKGSRLRWACLQGAGLFTFIAAEKFYVYAISYALIGMGISLMSPAYQSLLSKVLPQKLRGTGFGLIHSGLGFFPACSSNWCKALFLRWPHFALLDHRYSFCFAMFPAIFKFKLSDKDRQQIDAAEAKMIKDEEELKE